MDNKKYIEYKKYKQCVQESIKNIIQKLNDAQKIKLHNACERNCILTSEYGLENCDVYIFNEGYYICFSGCRCGYKIFYNTKTNAFMQKPKNITQIKDFSFKSNEIIDWSNLLKWSNANRI